ncbi:MAG TPA: VWA domain-containing protein [Acidisarcina sp.]
MSSHLRRLPSCLRAALSGVAGAVALSLLCSSSIAASGNPQTPAPASQSQNPSTQPPPDQGSPDAGGPGGDNGAIVIPRKKDQSKEPIPPPEPRVKNPPGMGNFALRVDVPVVTVDVGVVLEKTRQFVPNLKEENFKVYEDGVPQTVTGFQKIQAPITALLLCEFAATNYQFIYDMRQSAYAFAQQLKPDDYVAVMTYDMRTQLLTDFTQDKRQIAASLNSLQIPGFSETNLFDALYESLDRMSRIEGHKYIILIGSGRDTFSKLNLDKILAKIKATPNITIFAVGTGQAARIVSEGRMGPIREMDYLQADNQLTTFSRMTGGRAFFPRFQGEMPDIFHDINDSIRNQYVLTYKPTNAKMDGSYRKLHVELVDDEGKPLRMQDEKHHALKYDVIARDGYKAKQEVE